MRIKALGLVFVVGLSASLATAAADKRNYSAGRFALDIAGANAGYLKSATGGGVSGEVATSIGPSNVQKKHIARLKYDPVTLEVPAVASPELADWIDATLAQNAQHKNATLIDCSFDNKAQTEQPLTNALITEIGFPALNAATGKEAAMLTLKITPEQSQRRAAAGGACPAEIGLKQKNALSANFKLELDGINTSSVSAVDAFSIKVGVASDSVGEARGRSLTASKLEIPALVLSVSRARSEDFEKWAEDFLIKGNNADEKEKSGALVFLDPATKELARLSLSNVGISAFTVDPSDPGRFRVTLYVEGLRYSIGGAKPKALKVAAVAATKAAPAKVVPVKAAKKK